MTHLYASGRIAHYRGLLAHPLWTASLLVLAWLWSDLHFYIVHRMMHPTFPGRKGGLDPGRWMYRNVHYLHHKSYNPGPWSGLAMHPVEHLIYFTRGVSACLVAAHHPTIFLFYNMRAMLGPAPGHHGFPGMGASHVVAYLQCTARAHTICFRWVPVSLAASRQVRVQLRHEQGGAHGPHHGNIPRGVTFLCVLLGKAQTLRPCVFCRPMANLFQPSPACT